MPQPTLGIAAGPARIICRFGNNALPNGQGTQAWIDLNDLTSWLLQDFNPDHSNRQVGIAQYLFRRKAAFTSDDRGPKTIRLPMRFEEAGGVKLGAALAQLFEAGEQYLTFDNATAILAKLSNVNNRVWLYKYGSYTWTLELEFLGKGDWTDLAATAIASQPLVTAPPAAPSANPVAGGALLAGTYSLYYTYVTASGETAPSPLMPNIVLAGGNFQMAVGGVTLPSWATAVKWYFAAGSPTVGFTVQNNGAGFTLNTAGNGIGPPASTPATALAVAYPGSVFAEPVFTFTIPALVREPMSPPDNLPRRAAMVRMSVVSRGAGPRGRRLVAVYASPQEFTPQLTYSPITAVTIANTMSGESITVLFAGGLDPTLAWTITVDCGAMTAKDQNGKLYDATGPGFPQLYGPAGQSNPLTFAITQAAPPTPAVSLAGTFQNRWEI